MAHAPFSIVRVISTCGATTVVSGGYAPLSFRLRGVAMG